MINQKPTFWVNFTLFGLAAFLPLIVVLIVIFPPMQLTGLLLIIGVFVIIGLPLSLYFANIITKPIIDLAKQSQQIANSVDDEQLNDLDLEQFIVSGTAEVEFVERTLLHICKVLQNQILERNTLDAIGKTVTQEINYEDALEAVLTAVADIIDYDAAEIVIYTNEELKVDGWRGKEGLLNTTGRSYAFGRGLAGTIADTKEPLLVPVVTEDSTDSRRTLARGAIISEMLQRTERVVVNSFIGVPLLVNNELIGVMNMVHRTINHFSEHDQAKLVKLMSQASIAIHNAQEVKKREESLKMQIRELQIRIDETQKKKEVDAVVSSEYFKELREQAQVLRQAARIRQQKKQG